MKQNNRYSRIALVVIIVVAAALALLRFNSFQVGAFFDDAHYIILSEALATGQGYRMINFPQPVLEQNFPPGWPLLLTPVAALFPGNYTLYKLISLAFYLATIPLVYRLLSPRIKSPYLELVVALTAVQPAFLSISGMVMSEAAFLFFSFLTLNLCAAWEKQPRQSVALLVITALLAVFTQLIRTAGLSLLISLVLYLLLKRHFRPAVIAAVTIVIALIPQFLLNAQNGGSIISGGYQNQVFDASLGGRLNEVWVNFGGYTFSDAVISELLVPIFGPSVMDALNRFGLGFIAVIVNIVVLALLTFGYVLTARRFQLSEVYAVVYFLGILNFMTRYPGSPNTATDRFLFPLLPLLYFYVMQSVVWLDVRLKQRPPRRVMVLVQLALAGVIAFSVMQSLRDWRNPLSSRMTDLSVGTTWLRENAPEDAVIMTTDPIPHYLYARRKTVYQPAPEQDVEQYLDGSGVVYIMISPQLQANRSTQLSEYSTSVLLPYLEANTDEWEQVYRDEEHNVTIYKRVAPLEVANG